ncbi:MAG: hypothetical protein OHK0053_28770 [Microscillaceae bacterium]
MQDSYFSLSQAYDRYEQLRSKSEYEGLEESEFEELQSLRDMLQENADDYLSDF